MATTDLLSRHAGPIALAAGLLLAALDLGRLPIAAAADRAAALWDPLLVTVNAAYFSGFCGPVIALVALHGRRPRRRAGSAPSRSARPSSGP
jgi:hypothetical protein